jgi:hypothetical protein
VASLSTTIDELAVETRFSGVVRVDREGSVVHTDEPTGRAAVGYLAAEGLRTNVFHLPVCGSGDGGIHTTAADVHAL